MRKSKRYIVAFVSVLLGLSVTVAVAGVELRDRPRPQPAVRGSREISPEEQRMIFEWCVVFYATTYMSGRIIYKLLGAFEDAKVVAGTSGWHMPLLHLFGGLLLMEPLISNWHGGPNRGRAAILLAVVGCVLIAHAVFHLIKRTPPTTGQPQSPAARDHVW
jgi:hypothetical protein